MPLSSIVVIVLRLFAVNWLLTAVPLFLTAAATPLPRDRTAAAAVAFVYASPALLLIFTAVLWMLSGPAARFVSRGVDATVSVGSLSRSDLYSFAFVFLGLFFILSSVADVINWLHISARLQRKRPERPQPSKTCISLRGRVSRWHSASFHCSVRRNGPRSSQRMTRSARGPNQAMQLTASKPDVYASAVCRRARMLRTMHSGLTAADLVSR